MRRIPAIFVATFASVCSAQQSEFTNCDHTDAVACFIDHAQANLRACLRSPAVRPDTARTEMSNVRPPMDDKQERKCVAAANREIGPLYREALTAVQYQRGTTRAVTDYYDDWAEVLNRRRAAPAANSTGSADSWRADIERLNVKAEHLRKGR